MQVKIKKHGNGRTAAKKTLQICPTKHRIIMDNRKCLTSVDKQNMMTKLN